MNLGNTCYFNSALQMLMSVDGFVSDIIASYQADVEANCLNVVEEDTTTTSTTRGDTLSTTVPVLPTPSPQPMVNILMGEEEKKEEDEPMVVLVKVDPGTAVIKPKYPLRNALAQFFLLVRSLPSSSPTATSILGNSMYRMPMAVDPSELKQVIDSLTGQFIGYRQQDAHELVSTLLDLLHDELKGPVETEQKNKEEEEKDIDMAKEETVENHQNEQGKEQSVVKDAKEVPGIELKTSDSDSKTQVLIEEGGLEESQDDQSMDIGSESSLSETIQTNSLTVQVDHTDQKVETSKPKEEPEGFVLVEKMDLEDNGELNESTSSKKARTMSSSSSTLGDSYVHCASIPKTSSYSKLDVNDIATLLHGESGEISIGMTTATTPVTTPPRRSWASVAAAASDKSSASSTSNGKLIGGRLPHLPLPITLTQETHISSENDAKDEQSGAMDVDDVDDDNDSISHSASPLSCSSKSASESEKKCKKIITPVDTYFTTRVRTCLTCDSCHYTRSHEESFRYLSIEVGSGADNMTSSHDQTVTEGIRKFFSPEKRELKCEKCFCESATQTMEIIQLPRALLLHMKRFIVDISPDYSRISYRKNQAAIEFGEELSLNSDDQCGILGDFLGKDVQYPFSINKRTIASDDESSCSENDVAETTFKIRSIVNHIGSSASCGHYTADARKLYKKKDKVQSNDIEIEKNLEWTRFNDSYVSRINDCDAMQGQAQKTAYMLMYESG